MDPEAVILGDVLRQFRKAQQLSQETLAYESGVNRTHLSHLERGVKQPSVSTLYRLAHALKVPGSIILARFEQVSGFVPDHARMKRQDFLKQVDRDLRKLVAGKFIDLADEEAFIAYAIQKMIEAEELGVQEARRRAEEE